MQETAANKQVVFLMLSLQYTCSLLRGLALNVSARKSWQPMLGVVCAMSKLLVSLLIHPLVVPYIIPYITPF